MTARTIVPTFTVVASPVGDLTVLREVPVPGPVSGRACPLRRNFRTDLG